LLSSRILQFSFCKYFRLLFSRLPLLFGNCCRSAVASLVVYLVYNYSLLFKFSLCFSSLFTRVFCARLFGDRLFPTHRLHCIHVSPKLHPHIQPPYFIHYFFLCLSFLGFPLLFFGGDGFSLDLFS